jgi:glycerol-3-phosphate dehydrogenase (NAD(P)+)
VASAAAIVSLAARLQVEMPIVAAIDAVLHRGMAIERMIEELLARPRRAE